MRSLSFSQLKGCLEQLTDWKEEKHLNQMDWWLNITKLGGSYGHFVDKTSHCCCEVEIIPGLLKRGVIVRVEARIPWKQSAREGSHLLMYVYLWCQILRDGEAGDGVYESRPTCTSRQPVSLWKDSVMLRCHFCNTWSGSRISHKRKSHLFVLVQLAKTSDSVDVYSELLEKLHNAGVNG